MYELVQYLPKVTYLHKLSPISKLAFALMLSLSIALSRNVMRILSLLISLTFLLLWLCSGERNILKPYLRLILFSSLIMITSQSFFYWRIFLDNVGYVTLLAPTTLRKVPILGHIILFLTYGKGLVFSYDGLKYGLLVSIKFSSMLLTNLIVLLTTRPGDIARSLAKLGVPRGLIQLALIAIKFIPLSIEEFLLTYRIAKMRGMEFKMTKLHKNLSMLLKASTISLIRRAKLMAIALEMKGFSISASHYRKIALKKGDLMLVLFAIAVSTLLLI